MNRGYEPSRVVHLRNLPEDIDMDDVMELGRPFGPVISALRIKETQAFLYMQELKDAEELVNEYRQHPPKIGWRTVFVQFSQYTRLDVGPRKPDAQGRSVQHVERRVRDRSRERNSRRSSSPDSPPSPPLPDITVPFYMLPRADEPELSIPPTSRPQLVSYPTPHLASAARVPLITYPAPQAHVATAQNMDNSAAAGPAHADTGLPHQYPHHPPAASHSPYDERLCQPSSYYSNSTVHNVTNHQQREQQQRQPLITQNDQLESNWNCLHSLIERIAADVQATRHKATSDLLSCMTDDDLPLVNSLRRDFGERSLPAIVSTIVSLRELDDDLVSDLACLDAASVGSVTQLHSSVGVDDFAYLFLCIAEAVHDRRTGQMAAKRRRYDDIDNNDVDNITSSSALMYSQQNQTWTSAADYRR